jgi:hypothetical protein
MTCHNTKLHQRSKGRVCCCTEYQGSSWHCGTHGPTTEACAPCATSHLVERDTVEGPKDALLRRENGRAGPLLLQEGLQVLHVFRLAKLGGQHTAPAGLCEQGLQLGVLPCCRRSCLGCHCCRVVPAGGGMHGVGTHSTGCLCVLWLCVLVLQRQPQQGQAQLPPEQPTVNVPGSKMHTDGMGCVCVCLMQSNPITMSGGNMCAPVSQLPHGRVQGVYASLAAGGVAANRRLRRFGGPVGGDCCCCCCCC